MYEGKTKVIKQFEKEIKGMKDFMSNLLIRSMEFVNASWEQHRCFNYDFGSREHEAERVDTLIYGNS
jgi:hypothetical protein